MLDCNFTICFLHFIKSVNGMKMFSENDWKYGEAHCKVNISEIYKIDNWET